MKQCLKCRQEKELSQFSKRAISPDGLQNECKLCIKEYRSKNAAKIRVVKKIYNDNTKDKRSAWRRKRKYGLTPEAIEQMVKEQNGQCKICNKDFAGTFAVDHCHKSSKVRGLLCDGCNKGLGHFRDNPEFLIRAAKYLDPS